MQIYTAFDNTGTFVNQGHNTKNPLNPSQVPHSWYDLSVINEGIFECIESDSYGHYMQFIQYDGSYSVSYSTGELIINSKSTDYLQTG